MTTADLSAYLSNQIRFSLQKKGLSRMEISSGQTVQVASVLVKPWKNA